MFAMWNARRLKCLAGLLTLSVSAAGVPAQAGIVPIIPGISVGADANCAYRTDLLPNALQSAIDSIPANAGTTIIRVARNGDYSGAQVSIEDLDLDIRGGYTDCADSTPDNTNTVIDADGAYIGPVFTISGNGRQPRVTLRDLTIQGGRNNGSAGGGIYIDGADVRLLSTTVTDNQATYGGGIAIRSLLQEAALELDEGSGVTSNTASSNGGGIDCDRHYAHPITLRLQSASGVSTNEANRGGGIHANSCSGFINSGGIGIYGLIYNIGFNDAQTGGGIALENTLTLSTPMAELVLGEGLKASEPRPIITSNTSTALGGGVYVGIYSRLLIKSALINANTSGTSGGGVFLTQGDLATQRELPYCAGGAPCIVFSNNKSTAPYGGGALAASTNTEVNIDGARFEGNSAPAGTPGGTLLLTNGASVTVENSVFSGNSGDTLITADRSTTSGADLWLLASTIAGNSLTQGVIDMGADGLVSLGRTIVQDTVPVVIRDPANHGLQLTCNLLHEQASVIGEIDPASATLTGKIPGFIDAANHDYHLQRSGWAVDACAASGFFSAHDLDLNPRPIDAPISNLAGPFDVGAYEWTYDLFRDGFED